MSSNQTVKRFYVIQGSEKYPVTGYATACQLAHNLMVKNKAPCRIEVEFSQAGWGVQQQLEFV